MIPISERFVSIQGEGMLAGVPSSFIRTHGCNLRCVWCDEPETSWGRPREGGLTPTPMSIADLVAWAAHGPRHVVITGGEPLLHHEIVDLTRALRAAGHHVTIETAGTLAPEGLQADLISISPKLAHSTPRGTPEAVGHEKRRRSIHALSNLIGDHEDAWQLKFIVRAGVEGDVYEATNLCAALGIVVGDPEFDRVFLTPEGVDPSAHLEHLQALAPTCTALGFRLGPRLHLSLYGHTRGT